MVIIQGLLYFKMTKGKIKHTATHTNIIRVKYAFLYIYKLEHMIR